MLSFEYCEFLRESRVQRFTAHELKNSFELIIELQLLNLAEQEAEPNVLWKLSDRLPDLE